MKWSNTSSPNHQPSAPHAWHHGRRVLIALCCASPLLLMHACGGGGGGTNASPNANAATATPTAVPVTTNTATPTPTAAPVTTNTATPTTAPVTTNTPTPTTAPVTTNTATPTTTPAPVAASTQFTPNQANWTLLSSKPIAAGNTGHDPDSVSWITAAQWRAAEWDGTTTYDPTTMSRANFAAAICPSVDRVRGIREVFYQHNPFADNDNPTKAEIDEWHRIAINHVRALVGYTAANRQVQKDHCMFARAHWGDERKFTTQWDARYPGALGSAAGPCVGATTSNAHCGASFLPSAQDQAPYLPAGHGVCTATAGAEGVFNGPKSNIPWSIKWSRGFCNTLIQEGFWGGHTGPWYHREKFGFSFWDADANNNNSNTILRAKWTGSLMPSLYTNPNP